MNDIKQGACIGGPQLHFYYCLFFSLILAIEYTGELHLNDQYDYLTRCLIIFLTLVLKPLAEIGVSVSRSIQDPIMPLILWQEKLFLIQHTLAMKQDTSIIPPLMLIVKQMVYHIQVMSQILTNILFIVLLVNGDHRIIFIAGNFITLYSQSSVSHC